MKTVSVILILFLFSPSLLSASSTKRTPATESTSATESLPSGISVTITVSPSRTSPEAAIHKAFQEGKRVYRELDAQSSGEVALINKNAGRGKIKVSDDLLRLFRVCMQIYDWTGGFFDVVRAKPGIKIKDPQLRVDFGTREVSLPDRRTYLDFHGILYGYIIDRMSGVLKNNGVPNFMIQIGETYRTMGQNGDDYWRLNIPDPEGRGKMLCRVSLDTASIASADIRRPLRHPTDLQSVTIITTNATNATALAVTGLLIGKERGREMLFHIVTSQRESGFGAILEDRNGKILTIGDVTAACFEG